MKTLLEELRTDAPAVTLDTLRRAANQIERLEARVVLLEAILERALPVVRLSLYPKLAERIINALAEREQS